MATANASRPEWTVLGHPAGLFVLFLTEMWERFSYYGMRALLILYMVNYFKMTQSDASFIYKWYTSLVYLTPLVGGFLADRFLGNRWAVVIGAALMAVGHFLMAFEAYPIFFSALVFLIVGNGFFKPNMSTQVGRLYPINDPRRDGAYTIFYMGINLGAFLAPLVCGWLAENTEGGYHAGFTVAGIGMVLGLVIYVVGGPLVRELPKDEKAESAGEALTEAEAANTPSPSPNLNASFPVLLAFLTAAVVGGAAVLVATGWLKLFDGIAMALGGVGIGVAAWVAAQVTRGVRDRVIAIMMLAVASVFFWAAFEQAGNVLNLWADYATERNLTQPSGPPPLAPPGVPPEGPAPAADAAAASPTGDLLQRFTRMFALKKSADGDQKTWSAWFWDSLNPIPTTWLLAINPLGIFIMAPLFAWLWTALDRRGYQLSIPFKMTLGLVFVALSMLVMVGAAVQENRPSSAPFAGGSLPAGVYANDKGQLCYKPSHFKGDAGSLALETESKLEPFHAGRLAYDEATKTFHLKGVLPTIERERVVRETAPEAFKVAVRRLRLQAEKAAADAKGSAFRVTVPVPAVPEGFDWNYTGLKKSEIAFDPERKTITATKTVAERDEKAMLFAAGDAAFRTSIDALVTASAPFRVAVWWLVFSYVLATIGELCISPVGLSMVSKLAPKDYATLMMGMWLLTSFFGGFLAGTLGEVWEFVPPVPFFTISVVVVGAVAVFILLVAPRVARLMHGVR